MSAITLYDHQKEALAKMKNGCILCGGVGSGKSRTGLAYYYVRQGGRIGTEKYIPMKNPKDLYIITTAQAPGIELLPKQGSHRFMEQRRKVQGRGKRILYI